jgi:hypothetical protein
MKSEEQTKRTAMRRHGRISGLLAVEAATAAAFDVSVCHRVRTRSVAAARPRLIRPLLTLGDSDGDADDEGADVDAFRAQLMRQFAGGGAAADPAPETVQVRQASELRAGQVLVANPELFCSRNPFSRPVKDLGRFGLQGPIVDDQILPDMKAKSACPLEPDSPCAK